MPITLTPEQEAILNSMVARGDFPTADAALNHALAFHLTRAEWKARRADLSALIRQGLDSVERGETTPFDPVKILAGVRTRRG